MAGIKRRNESKLTGSLKRAAWRWLYEVAGCKAIAFEVRLEGPRGRIADVVGIGPGNRVYLVEVKSSRPDAARDDNTPKAAAKLAAKMTARDNAVELTAGILEAASNSNGRRDANGPELAQAKTDYEKAVKRRDAHSRRVARLSTKFHDDAYLRTAHCHYIMAPRGVVRISQLPPYWGLLDDTPAVVVEAPVKQVKEATTQVLRSIARANTRDMMAAFRELAAGEKTVPRP